MFQSADPLVMDSSSAMSAYSDRWSTGSMRMQSPLEVYQANIRLAQLIIEMLGLSELQYAYKLAASLGEHIVSRLAQNSDARIEGKQHPDRLGCTNPNDLLTQSCSASGMTPLQHTPSYQEAQSPSAFRSFSRTVSQSLPATVCANKISRSSERMDQLSCKLVSQSPFVPAISTPLPSLNHLLNQESYYPVHDATTINTKLEDEAIDLTVKHMDTESILLPQSSYSTNHMTDELEVNEDVNNTQRHTGSNTFRYKAPVRTQRTRVIGGRKPRLTSRSGVNRQTRRKSRVTPSSGSLPSKRMALRNRPIRRNRYTFDSPTVSPSKIELPTDMIACTTTTSIIPISHAVYGESNREMGMDNGLVEPHPLPVNRFIPSLEYRTLLTNQYTPSYTVNPVASHQMCYTCCIQLKDPLSFVKHIQQVHLGISVPEMKTPSTDPTQTNWSTFENKSIEATPSAEGNEPQSDHIKIGM
ncbi:hypothetical protein D915_001965 [Fasciola hepatica]|uniref:Uncharacterized protein n=1 Tax=Fasciola hepatica TaxID=6192 RepID=A0A4E0RWB8_FASHE|nr:hypothetical protein D915_001965 [Fasciola hepatica]